MSQSLTEERKNLPFDIRDLSVYIYETEEGLRKISEVYKILNEDPILKNDFTELGKGRIEQFKMFAEKNRRLHELLNLTEGGTVAVLHHFGNQLPGSLSTYMFIPYIRYMGTDEQVEKWLERALRMEVIGTYAQTELGHGSDVRSLETTATFDQEKDEFIINSPTLTSTKFWPGDLGLCANHVVCFAQLILNGEKKGVHGFIVQIRDLETNKLLPGIDAGDLGEKVGFNTKDNGYCRFNNIRIPRENMLQRYVKVSKKGEYKRKGDERVGYAIMMQVRDMLSHTAWRMLSHAIIISTRYSLVRTQFQNDDGVERKVMDYQLQQDKLIPLIAAVYAMHAGAKKVSQMTQQNIRNIQEREDFSMMKDLHATLCGTKAFYSYEADTGINKARLACGGHGYSSYSGFTALWREFSPTPTYEGENTVMALQTARYLLNCLEKVKKGSQLHDNAEYLKNLKEILSIQKCSAKKANDFDLDLVLTTLQANAAYIIYGASRSLMAGFKEVGLKEAWDRKSGLILFEAARAHMNVYTYRAFYDRINSEIKSPALKASMSRLCLLYGVHKLLEQPLGLMESEYFSSKQFTLLRKRKEDLLEQIRPDVIGLVDAFAIPDGSLRTVLGRYDGNVYETMMKMVKEVNEFNHYDWTETWTKHIKTLRDVKRPSPKL